MARAASARRSSTSCSPPGTTSPSPTGAGRRAPRRWSRAGSTWRRSGAARRTGSTCAARSAWRRSPTASSTTSARCTPWSRTPGSPSTRSAASMSDEDWKEVLDTNLTGTFYVCRQFLPTMLGNGFGRVVMIGSLSAGGVTGQASYAASKAGMIGLSRTLAKEYGRRGITSNVVVPGFFDTDMTRDGMSDSNKSFWMQYCPAGRMGELSEVAKVVSFLITEGAAYVNGQAIEVNGGLDWAP
ncbi:MAG: SDR family oxidoreductase [Sandaracinaceae bacterium]|nr:SDR family oxidoreductase [Sandaracinaceae bacterium]